MPADYKVLVHPKDSLTAGHLKRSGLRIAEYRGWLQVEGSEWKSDAESLSARLMTPAVWFSMQRPRDQVWLVAFDEGRVARELRFSAEKDGWDVNRGEGLPFEKIEALAKWLKAWRARKKKPLTARDCTTLLHAFIGAKTVKKR